MFCSGCSGHYGKEMQMSRSIWKLLDADVLDAGVAIYQRGHGAEEEVQQGGAFGDRKPKWSFGLPPFGGQPCGEVFQSGLLGGVS